MIVSLGLPEQTPQNHRPAWANAISGIKAGNGVCSVSGKVSLSQGHKTRFWRVPVSVCFKIFDTAFTTVSFFYGIPQLLVFRLVVQFQSPNKVNGSIQSWIINVARQRNFPRCLIIEKLDILAERSRKGYYCSSQIFLDYSRYFLASPVDSIPLRSAPFFRYM